MRSLFMPLLHPRHPFPGAVLDLADACDVPGRWACRTGVCHTCTTPLLSGDVTYSPGPAGTPADGEVLICWSQPGTDIVLEM
jgi:ferredoxin